MGFRIWKKDISENKHVWSSGLTTYSNETKMLSIVCDNDSRFKKLFDFFKRPKKKDEDKKTQKSLRSWLS